jgi:hypothetical protein
MAVRGSPVIGVTKFEVMKGVVMKNALKKTKSNLVIDRSPLSATETELVEIGKKKKRMESASRTGRGMQQE